MIEIFYKSKGHILSEVNLQVLENLGLDDVLWIDLNNPTGEEKHAAEDFLNTTLQSRAQAEEIESSSRYSETETTIFANTNFLIPGPEEYSSEPVSFILSEGILVTLRHAPLRTLSEVQRRLLNNYRIYPTGYHIMVSILENRIDVDADLVEILAKEITQLSRRIDLGESMGEDFLLDVNQLQENTMVIRENGVDKQRVISSILKSDKFPRDVYSKLEVLNKDVDSLINHANFSFERLEYLQNTVLGLINLEQNKLMRIFTFVSLLLMPPTLIASIYGMNIKLPVIGGEKIWDFVLLIGMMLFSVLMALFLFRKRKMIK
ncbi:MAG: CorA family divalent cation transporter [Bacteroidales bacterium]|jgi:magnesium transporter|nr:CorA family divalent cation transporter [Bacteroidales bacterium]MDD4256300.1 CorA family divalent cation transporter [Bacteroidales bacterium]MDD4654178.1 CorA family divalent cation transporter [Bacteroidales bacterium]MDD4827124.1 CorA family divalent cation transporter [Bacteroidales bacterium]HNY24433.1 CorA family divalent cation transporter [Bacteroidales bacterium]